MQNRNRLISFMQTFGIILVVLGHSTYQLMQAGHTPAIYKWIYTFHMPLFFFISGYLLRYSNDRKDGSSPTCPHWEKTDSSRRR